MKKMIMMVILGIAAVMSVPQGVNAKEVAKVNYGYFIVPVDQTGTINVLALQELAQQSLVDCANAVNQSKPGTYIAKVQFLNRSFFAVVGAFAMYGIICYGTGYCETAVWTSVGMATYIISTNLGDYFSERARYKYNELWYCMVLEGDDRDQKDSRPRFLVFPTERVPDGEVRVRSFGLTRAELRQQPKYPLAKYRKQIKEEAVE